MSPKLTLRLAQLRKVLKAKQARAAALKAKGVVIFRRKGR